MWPEQGQVELFGDGDFRCPLSNLPARAVRVDGGYRIDGWWDYGSGCDTATHFIGGVAVEGEARPHPLGGLPARGLLDRRQLGHARHARHRLAPRRGRGPASSPEHHTVASPNPERPVRRVPGPRRAREPDLPRRHDHAAARLRARGGGGRHRPGRDRPLRRGAADAPPVRADLAAAPRADDVPARPRPGHRAGRHRRGRAHAGGDDVDRAGARGRRERRRGQRRGPAPAAARSASRSSSCAPRRSTSSSAPRARRRRARARPSSAAFATST